MILLFDEGENLGWMMDMMDENVAVVTMVNEFRGTLHISRGYETHGGSYVALDINYQR